MLKGYRILEGVLARVRSSLFIRQCSVADIKLASPQKHVQMQLLDRTVNCLHSGHPTSCKNFTGGPSFPFPKVQMVVSPSLSLPSGIPPTSHLPPPRLVSPVSDEIQVRVCLSSAKAVPLPNVSLCVRHSGDFPLRCEA